MGLYICGGIYLFGYLAFIFVLTVMWLGLARDEKSLKNIALVLSSGIIWPYIAIRFVYDEFIYQRNKIRQARIGQ